jgi:hypothetical protein
MASGKDPNARPLSTTRLRRTVRISPAPHGKAIEPAAGRPPVGRRWYHLRWVNPRQVLTLRVKYVGGSRMVVRVDARGSSGEFTGDVAIWDVLAEIWRWDDKPDRKPGDWTLNHGR